MRASDALVFLVILLLSGGQLSSVQGTLSPNDKPKSKHKELLRGPQDDDVFSLGLVSPEPLAKDILAHHRAYHKDTAARRFNGTTLGYVTPWNSHGYDVAKIFAKKFDIISPVWLQIVKQGDAYAVAGMHDIDAGWVSDVRRKGKVQQQQLQRTVKVFPRFIFDHFTDRDIKLLLSDAKERTKVNDVLIKCCKDNHFDGLVLEVWSQLAGRIDDKILFNLVLQMAKELQKQQLRLILVIPPFRKDTGILFGEKHMDTLYKHIYAFSLMTYDFSSVQRPGANAPLYFVRQAVETIAPKGCHDMEAKRSKILLGLNMYGNDYTPDGGGPITFSQYLDLVKNVKKHLTYDERDVENFFEIKNENGRHIVFYPTLYSINERVKLAQELGVGISIWELGQGLNYFYDLF
ncbi:GL18725 [Drosophila persimilis]|uniref:Chitinase domain-containing protein 1 n=2 Tax=pseudoobscura subgroup TaxID=32358 RepID=Q29ML2_DROPS|nr:chitinase domain-containing protein 1 [Drosophila pseudoobscura]XP_002014858.1 chitinase domain-containing protein 1 [Drosophila persimilis]EDW28854.1 GL18725 [Drosophila persimilis]